MGRQVHLVRHLRTEGVPSGWIGHRELREWFRSEDDRGLAPGWEVPEALADVVASSTHLLVSPLARAQQTAAGVLDHLRALGRPAPGPVTVPHLREAPLPAPPIPFVRVPLDLWDVVSRLSWSLGYAGGVESHASVAERATRAAVEADRLSHDGPVTIIAHGWFNLMTGKRLRSIGWTGPRITDHRNGSVTRFTAR